GGGEDQVRRAAGGRVGTRGHPLRVPHRGQAVRVGDRRFAAVHRHGERPGPAAAGRAGPPPRPGADLPEVPGEGPGRPVRDGRRALEREREKLASFEYGRTVQIAYQEWRANNLRRARQLLDETRPGLRGWEWRYVHRLCHADLLTLTGHAGPVYAAAFGPDG